MRKLALTNALESTGGNERQLEWAVGTNYVWVTGGDATEVYVVEIPTSNIDDAFVVQYEPGIDVSLAGQQFRLRAFDTQDMYFGALNVAGVDPEGKLHALADTRRHGAQYVSPAP